MPWRLAERYRRAVGGKRSVRRVAPSPAGDPARPNAGKNAADPIPSSDWWVAAATAEGQQRRPQPPGTAHRNPAPPASTDQPHRRSLPITDEAPVRQQATPADATLVAGPATLQGTARSDEAHAVAPAPAGLAAPNNGTVADSTAPAAMPRADDMIPLADVGEDEGGRKRARTGSVFGKKDAPAERNVFPNHVGSTEFPNAEHGWMKNNIRTTKYARVSGDQRVCVARLRRNVTRTPKFHRRSLPASTSPCALLSPSPQVHPADVSTAQPL